MLALLPTATANILEAMNTERITLEIQQMRGSAVRASSLRMSTSAPPSIADSSAGATDDDGRSLVSLPVDGVTATATTTTVEEGSKDGVGQQPLVSPPPAPRKKTKRQLWDELAISCTLSLSLQKLL